MEDRDDLDREDLEGERLQKVMARAGVASRRQAEEMITAGRVTVNGEAASLGMKVTPMDRIAVDGRPLAQAETFQYYVLYKPMQVITSAKDPQGRKTVLDLLRDVPERVYPVGRLDYDTSGVLLLTNDGELAHRLMHPSYGVEKTYRVTVKGRLSPEALGQLRDGVLLEDGKTAPAQVKVISSPEGDGSGQTGFGQDGWTTAHITIHEGKNRQVRRMFAAVGYPVRSLERIRFGPLTLTGDMAPGQYRPLTRKEIHTLRLLVKLPPESRSEG